MSLAAVIGNVVNINIGRVHTPVLGYGGTDLIARLDNVPLVILPEELCKGGSV
jgi:hypothetical protein